MFTRRNPKDFSHELRAHLALETDRLRKEGLDESESRRRAHLNLGNLTHHEERFYESSRWIWFDQLLQDIRYALRQLRQAPGFALTATLTLALGIGATTSIFTLIHAVLLKPLPVTRPDQLYGIGDTAHGGVWAGMAGNWGIFSFDLYKQFRDHTPDFEELAACQGDPRRIGVRRAGSAEPAEPSIAEYVSGNYFSTLGVGASIGRVLNPGDDRADVAPVAMLSYRVWQQKYGLDPAVIGSTFNLNGAPVRIVGATPPGFFGETLRSNPPEFWLPLNAEPVVNRGAWVNNSDLHWLYVIGRVRRGADAKAIEAQMLVGLRQWLSVHASRMGPGAASQIPRQTLHLSHAGSGLGSMRTTYQIGLRLLMTISGFVLLIVCANLANLMLVRGLVRRRQTSISLALGAARSRVVRQALTESVLLALIGGAGGLAIAFGATQVLLSTVFMGSSYVPIDPAPDRAVLLFAFLVSLITGVLFGIAPAWTANHTDPMEVLRGAGRSISQAGALPQRTLVVVQAAISVVLLSAAGLLMQSLLKLQHQKFGFAAEHRMAVRIDPNLAGYKVDQLEPLYQKIKERFANLPSVRAVSYSLYSPMSGSSWSGEVLIEGQPAPASGDNISSWNRVGPDYFDAVGTRIVRGRPITAADTAATRHVAVVSEEFARQFWKGGDAIGKHFGAVSAKYANNFEVVGVAEDAKYLDPERPVAPMFFLPRSQSTSYEDPAYQAFETRSHYANDVVLWLKGRDDSVGAQIRRVFAEIDPNLPVIYVKTFETQFVKNVSQQLLIARLTSLFGLTALLLASLGLYGVTSYSVARRAREIGIRMALGADRRAVAAMVLRNACMLVGIGLAIGVPLTFAMGRILNSSLYGTSGHNPAIIAGATFTLAASALVATLVPARRAASLDPIETLRSD